MPIPSTILEYEQIIKFITAEYASGKSDDLKSEIRHAVSTGSRLFDLGYGRDIVVAGYLHDALEDGVLSEEQLREAYGERGANIIKANSKDTTINGRENRYIDIFDRCVALGEDAVIVKAADIYDNYIYFKNIDQEDMVAFDVWQAKELLKRTESISPMVDILRKNISLLI